MSVLAGTDFFTAEVLTWRGLVTYYVLFFIHLDTRRVSIAGITEHPDAAWMEQMGRCFAGCLFWLTLASLLSSRQRPDCA